jgi:hypothetical protein
MKHFSLLFTILCLIGMLTPLITLIQSTTNTQIVFSMVLFTLFGGCGTIVVVMKNP